MKTNNNIRYHKKIPYYLLLAFLTTGAGLILGFLSFGGMYVLFPVLPLAFGAFALSVAYEGEIYLQNIKGALNKLFKYNYLENYIAREFLLTNYPETEEYPQFFQDYKAQLQLLEPFAHKTLDEDSRVRKQRIESTLKDMEKWFALQLFTNQATADKSPYAQELATWLAQNNQSQWQVKLTQRKSTFFKLRVFSALAGAFMTLGTTYLIVEAFSVIPFFMAIPFTAWPFLIVPMALIAGTAYGMLTYNATTDFVNNDTINTWNDKFQKDWKKGLNFHNVVMGTAAVFLLAITAALTICTAGTWWTVATNARPLFDWMKKIPPFIMGVINPIITGLSAVCFNFQNTTESLELVDQAMKSKKGFWQQLTDYASEVWSRVRQNENKLQMLNPFRIILKLTILPLRVLFFIGHLLSIGVTANRMPGVSEKLAALIAIISEGFEDAHYFVGHNHADYEDTDQHQSPKETQSHSLKAMLTERLSAAHSHNHDVDIPTIMIKTIALPIYFLAATWDYLTSQLNTDANKVLGFKQAWNKQRGVEKGEQVDIAQDAQKPSTTWQEEHAIALIEKHQRKQLDKALFNRELADKKVRALNTIKTKIRDKNTSLAQTLTQAQNEPVFNTHRLFAQNHKTSTQEFVEELSVRVLH